MTPYRKIISVLASFALVVGLCPSIAYAADQDDSTHVDGSVAQADDGIELSNFEELDIVDGSTIEEMPEPSEPEPALEADSGPEGEQTEELESPQMCGEGLEWSIDEYGTLIITGEGVMWDFSDIDPAPWADQAASITSLIIEEGATSIGANAFNCLYALCSVQLPDSIIDIPEGAFDGTPYQVAIDGAEAIAEEEQLPSEEPNEFEGAEFEEDAETEALEEEIDTEAVSEVDEANETDAEEAAESVPADEKNAAPVRESSTKDSAKADEDDLELTSQATSSDKCGENLTWSYSNGTLTISGKGRMYDYPDASKVPWKSIQSNVRNIVFSSGVTYIGQNAFVQLADVRSITLPSSLKEIGFWAFSLGMSPSCSTYVSSLESWLNISGDGIGSSSPIFNSDLYVAGKKVTSLTIPSSVTKVRAGAFAGCKSIKTVTIPSSVTSIGDIAFSCPNLSTVIGCYSVSSLGGNSCFSMGNPVFYVSKGSTGWNTLKNAGYNVLDRKISNATVSLSYTKANYSGNARKPGVSVTLNGKKLVSGTDYVVAYSNNVRPGTATVKVTGKGKYSGSKSVSFKIAPYGWIQSSGYWYYYGSDNKKVTGPKSIDGKRYVFSSTGRMLKGGWKSSGGNKYYLRSDGSAYTSKWLQSGSRWYWFNSKGCMATGRTKVGTKYCLFSSTGVMQSSKWVQTNGKWRYYLSSGYEARGWQSIGGRWYWFDSYGIMATGTRTIGGTTYRFSSSGAWIG